MNQQRELRIFSLFWKNKEKSNKFKHTHTYTYTNSYRCDTPVVGRATSQQLFQANPFHIFTAQTQ
jgi:hypothetical protein